ncbi:hypothetical protein C3E78_09100 [Aeromicrobium chenweiae]|uniref:Uncharacterized protein n=2 Tax=Aeromicrobium chenweiae TaxID=2079793 RepID=A0A2S0WM58_9ACTN|nr:hypothetical protein C3E78_09100 [Aeromicrobium chenweiae]
MLTARPSAGRQPLITVVVLGEEFLGALAYALECALFMPAAVRAVRAGSVPGMARPSPIPVQELGDSPLAALLDISTSSDRMVAQQVGDDAHQVLRDLRRSTHSPLVEVDDSGVVLRVSDPRGWSVPAVASGFG